MAAGLQRKNAILRNELRHLKRQAGGDGPAQQPRNHHEGSFDGGGGDNGGHTNAGSRAHRFERGR